MRLTGVRNTCVFLIGFSILSMGCTGLTKSEPRPSPFSLEASSSVSHRSGSKTSKSSEQAEIVPAGAIETKAQEQSSTEPVLKDVKELTAEVLVDNVLARNPSITQMNAAWQAASARFPQVTSLDDPLAGTTLAPAGLGSNPAAYRVELFQRIPYPGKLSLRGEIASAEAIAISRDVEGMRQQLTEAARDAFYEYYLIARSAEVNDEVVKSLRMSRSTC
jgi:cobalt-zinc-cadmium efflux system outer membrane protein